MRSCGSVLIRMMGCAFMKMRYGHAFMGHDGYMFIGWYGGRAEEGERDETRRDESAEEKKRGEERIVRPSASSRLVCWVWVWVWVWLVAYA